MHSPGPEVLLLGGRLVLRQSGYMGGVPRCVRAEHLVHPESDSSGPDLPRLPLLLNLGPLTLSCMCSHHPPRHLARRLNNPTRSKSLFSSFASALTTPASTQLFLDPRLHFRRSPELPRASLRCILPASLSILYFKCTLFTSCVLTLGRARQAPLSMGFSRQEYWSGVPFPSPASLVKSR